MLIKRELITPEILANTLKQEVLHEVKVISPPIMGKVRTVYPVSREHLLMISSDNLSTHDIIHKRQIYGKGENLDAVSSHFFDETQDILPNHYVRTLGPNVWLVRRADPIRVEFVFRIYLTGSAWKAYEAADGHSRGMIFCGEFLRPGYRKNEALDTLLFTPTAKGKVKDFFIPEFASLDPEEDDPKITLEIIRKNYRTFGFRNSEDIDFVVERFGMLYDRIYSNLRNKDQLLADTKWEAGYIDGKLCLIDECVTPDSSRFWLVSAYKFNPEKNEFAIVQGDKQPFRDYIEKLGLHKNKTALAEHWMPDKVVIDGIIRYANLREDLTGTQMEITTRPRKQMVLEAIASGGFLR